MLLRRNKADVLKIPVCCVVIFILNKVSIGKGEVCSAFCFSFFNGEETALPVSIGTDLLIYETLQPGMALVLNVNIFIQLSVLD